MSGGRTGAGCHQRGNWAGEVPVGRVHCDVESGTVSAAGKTRGCQLINCV